MAWMSSPLPGTTTTTVVWARRQGSTTSRPAPPRALHPEGRGPRVARSSREKLTGDDEALHLARALADGAQLHVAVDALDQELARVPVATVDLDSVGGGPAGGFAGKELRHRG